MNEFELPATEDAIAYLQGIAGEMVGLFGIDRDEAVGRIRKFWRGQAFLTRYELMALFHREEDGWARHIYYGGQPWWLKGPPPEPAPYP